MCTNYKYTMRQKQHIRLMLLVHTVSFATEMRQSQSTLRQLIVTLSIPQAHAIVPNGRRSNPEPLSA